jgi:hypothetical protein
MPLNLRANPLLILQREIKLAIEMAYYFINYLVKGCAVKVLLYIFLIFLGLRHWPYRDSILI